MGNLHSERKIGYINPPENPYKDIVPLVGSVDGQTHRYKDSLGGMDIFLVDSLPQHELEQITPHGSITLPLLPRLETIPPSPIHLPTHIEEVIDIHLPKILDAITSRTAALICDHGSSFGLLPEATLQKKLTEQGLMVIDSFPRTGGRKRMQKHAVIFEKPKIQNDSSDPDIDTQSTKMRLLLAKHRLTTLFLAK